MDAKQYFRECCKELGIDDSKFFALGNQNGETKNRLCFRPSRNAEWESHIFAINYYSTHGIYVAWRTEIGRYTKREVFSVKKESLSHIPSNFVMTVSKGVPYSNWDQELVYAFKPDSVKLFLEQCVLSAVYNQ